MAWNRVGRTRADELPANWASVRRQVLERDGHTCLMCGQPGNQVDHIERGFNHHPSNLRTLCQACHMRRTGRDGGRTRRTRRTPSWCKPEIHPGLLHKKQGYAE